MSTHIWQGIAFQVFGGTGTIDMGTTQKKFDASFLQGEGFFLAHGLTRGGGGGHLHNRSPWVDEGYFRHRAAWDGDG